MTEPHQGEQPAEVLTLELFFDLVFVFTLTQMTRLLTEDLTWSGVLRVCLVFGLLWYMYGGYAWLTNQVPPRRPGQQLLMLVGMGGFLSAAVAIPNLFEETGPLFGVGYVVVVVVHLLLFRESGQWDPGVARLAPFNLASATLVLTAGLVGGVLRPVLLVAALVLQGVTPFFGVASKFVLKAKHFVERHGLLMIVALGETVIAVGLGVDPTNLDVLVLVTLLLAFSLPAALWWAYFSDDTDSAAAALDAKEPGARSIVAIRGFFYAYIPMLLGIVFLAAGIHEALADPTAHPSLAVAMALGGGVGAFLLGDAGFRRVLEIGSNRWRLLASGLALASVPIGTLLPVWIHLLILSVLMVGVLLGERSRQREPT